MSKDVKFEENLVSKKSLDPPTVVDDILQEDSEGKKSSQNSSAEGQVLREEG